MVVVVVAVVAMQEQLEARIRADASPAMAVPQLVVTAEADATLGKRTADDREF